MYKFKGKDEIGKYLNELILSKYPSKRQFGKAYLEELGLDTSQDDIRKMSNKITQITKGKKGIPSDDLPVFTKLLGISCEQLLSCGTEIVPLNSRITNYAIAYSNDRELWESYLLNPEQPFLNYDEYGFSVLDYALEAKNMNLINFLIEKGLFVFKGRVANSEYGMRFEVGNQFARRDPRELDMFHDDIYYNDRYRTSIIALAMENGAGLEALREMRAREIPELTLFNSEIANSHRYLDCCNSNFNDAIAHSSSDVLNYFSSEFTYGDNSRQAYLLFPFLGEVIDIMLHDKLQGVEMVIDNAIEHNKNIVALVKQDLKSIISRDYNSMRYRDDYTKGLAIKTALLSLKYAANDGLFSFGNYKLSGNLILSTYNGNTKYRDKLNKLNSYAEDVKNYMNWEFDLDE